MASPVVLGRPMDPPQRGESSAAMARFTNTERHFVRLMKRRDRSSLVRLIETDTKRQCVTHPDMPLRLRVLQSHLPESVRMQIFEELRSAPHEKYMQWVRRAIQLPCGVVSVPYALTSPTEAVAAARATMDAAVTGFDELKTEVLKLVCQSALNGASTSAYGIGLEGEPGTGKTHFVRTALAPALQRPMVSIQLGGATDVSYLLGMLYTYEGAREGRIASGLIEAGCCNPVVYFDEVDKISDTDRGRELASALIHLIDPSSNTEIRDRYFHGIDIDVSKCTFVFSYNNASRVSPILLDRIRRFRVATPTMAQRCDVLKRHIVPRVTKRLCTDVSISDEGVAYLAKVCAQGAEGMRGAEQAVYDTLSLAQLQRCVGGADGAADALSLDAVRASCRHAAADEAPPPLGMYS
jgi:ATP-dependent Lon protease